MKTARQLSIFLDNKPGTLADVCKELANAKINIFALSISDTTDYSVVRMVVSEPQKALHLLGERGVLVVENDVLLIENANKPGTLAEIAHRLAKAKINIEYAYLSTSPTSKKGLAVIRVSETKKALKALADF
ncbi:ACT domain-containing protein [Verrucomicrobiota bacterium sgz303538]